MRSAFLLASSLVFALPTRISLDDVELRGRLEPVVRHITARIGTTVHVPFGSIDVSGHVSAQYECTGAFSGTVTYSRVIRVLAAIKHVTLVSSVSGRAEPGVEFDCDAPRDSIGGDFHIRDSVLTGLVRYGSERLSVRGHVARDGPAYDVTLFSADSGGRLATVRLK